MNTPIADFINKYSKKNVSRFHMPGHKGQAFLGCETMDITEVKGADALYEADSIIAESEKNATALFGTERTIFSTEGSSQCIRAMLYLAVNYNKLSLTPSGTDLSIPNTQNTSDFINKDITNKNTHKPYVIAARNVHKAFLYAAALIDFDIIWLYPEEMHSLCSCHISPEQLELELKKHTTPPAAVYITSPDYLGGQPDIEQLANICHQYHTILAVDNAHGSYLHFLEKPVHPIDLGADICCDSAHKTLPVLTGGAYLQISKQAPSFFSEYAKQAMALFGSTSPSYLTLASLDLCNSYLDNNYKKKLNDTIIYIETVKNTLRHHGWYVEKTEPLKITIQTPCGLTGTNLADKLRLANVECEYADAEYIVFMVTPENTKEDYDRLIQGLGINKNITTPKTIFQPIKCIQKLSVREAIFGKHQFIPVKEALGKICGTPTVGCPPAVPIVISGERIDENAIALFNYYGITTVDVIQ